MTQNIKALFLDLGGTFREVYENKPFSDAARKRIAEICKTDMSPDDYYDFLNKRYDVYREWVLHFMCEPPEQYLWSRWLCPELDIPPREERCREHALFAGDYGRKD